MLSSSVIKNHADQVALLGSASNIDPVKFPRRYELAMQRQQFDAERKKPRKVTTLERQRQDRMSLLKEARQLARTCTATKAAEIMGITRHRLVRLAEDYHIVFLPSRTETRAERDAASAERIRAFLAIGLTRRQAVMRLGLGYRVFKRVCDSHGIHYPGAEDCHGGEDSGAA